MTYPDGEELYYAYDNGGFLKAAWGEKSGNRYDYITTLLYDEFGQRTYIVYGNGTKSTYAYDDLTRRLATLKTVLKDGREIQKLSYGYDLVGNVGEAWNNIAVPTNTALPAGPVKQKYDYDDLYQIVNAQGWYSFGPGKENNYHNEFFYDTIGNFTKKNQVHKIIQPSTTETLPKETNYVLKYVYGSDKPHAVRDAGDKLYTYDANGNMTGWTHKQNGTRRTITWNEDNRVKQIDDNGKSTYFLYDDSGERVVKRGQHGETIYVNRFFSIRNGELGTKSVYAGETRVVSKLVKTPPTNTANSSTTSSTSTSGSNSFPNQGTDQALQSGKGKKLGIIKRLPDGYQVGVNPPVEKDQFYYHGDHLGSSNMITDAYGAVYQHLEYFPYGETWIEEGGSYGGNTPGYKFTGKELDPETGLYYYGARYYEPVLSRWISADPIFEKYLPTRDSGKNPVLTGLGGIFNPANINIYSYTHNKPVVLNDPDGKVIQIPVAVYLYVAAVVSSPDLQFDLQDLAMDASQGDMPSVIADIVGIAIPGAQAKQVKAGVKATEALLEASAKAVKEYGPEIVEFASKQIEKIGIEKALKQAKKLDIEGVYEFVSSTTKEYVGQSKNVLHRLQQHMKKGFLDTKDLLKSKMDQVFGSSKTQREIREQIEIKGKGGIESGNLANQRNPLSPERQKELMPGQ